MSVLALSDGVVIAWWVALAVGLVVAVVVWALLEVLRRTVLQVEEGVTAVWTMGKRVAQNTQTTYLLQTTKARGVDLLDELGRRIVRQAGDIVVALDGARENTTALFDVTRTNVALDRITRDLATVRERLEAR